jgi:hypothetical protein
MLWATNFSSCFLPRLTRWYEPDSVELQRSVHLACCDEVTDVDGIKSSPHDANAHDLAIRVVASNDVKCQRQNTKRD